MFVSEGWWCIKEWISNENVLSVSVKEMIGLLSYSHKHIIQYLKHLLFCFFLVITATVTEKKMTSEFNGILSAFCVLLFIIGIVVAYFVVKR